MIRLVWQLFLTRARAGCHKVRWTLALARPRGALALREIKPKLQSSWVSRSAPHFSDNKRGCEKTRLIFFTSPKNVRKLPLVYQKFLYCFFSKFLLFYCPLFSFFIHVANFIYNWIKRCDFHISSE